MTTLIQSAPRIRVDLDSMVATLPPPVADSVAWSRYFEDLYHDAAGEAERIPWADRQANPALQAWLNNEAPSLVRPGASACVVGCGLGDDVRELADRGYDVIGFDVSASAVQWARARHPDMAERFLVADLFQLPASLRRRSDLVVEVNTIQAVHPGLRAAAAAGIASLARPHGTVIAICRGRDGASDLPAAPPYPLCPGELCDMFAPHGMLPTRGVDDFLDDEDPPVRRLRVALKRG